MKKILTIVITAIIFSSLFSCEEYLNVPPSGVFSEANITNTAGVNQLLIGAYAHLTGDYSDFNVPNIASAPQGAVLAVIHGGEAMKGGSNRNDQPFQQEFQEFNITPGNLYSRFYWIFSFDAIDRCNIVLKTLKNVTDITEEQRKSLTAQARFLRGHYYFMMKRAFKNVPWIDENTTDVRVPNTLNSDGVTFVNVWPQITEDFDYARKNLPPTQIDLGRPNKWAAEAYYAKVMIYRANEGEFAGGYTEALTVLNNVMTNGVTAKGEKYALLPYYYYNFSAANENGPESVFAVQHSANDGIKGRSLMFGGAPNGNIEGRVIASNASSGPASGAGFGFYQPSFWYVDHFRVNGKGLPFLDMYATNSRSVKNDLRVLSSQPFTTDTASLDPRLDWSVGRRGIPFHDYGLMPGADWIRNQQDGGPYMNKKWNVKKSQLGLYTPSATEMRNAINVCIIRYADVLLLAAECEARVGSLTNARNLVNQVRDRMVKNSDNPNNWVKMSNGANAANYKIGLYSAGAGDPFLSSQTALDAILYERTLELGFEGHRFYDVVRFGKGEEEFNNFLTNSIRYFDWLAGKSYKTVPDALLPIPTTAIDNSLLNGVPTITQNPGY